MNENKIHLCSPMATDFFGENYSGMLVEYQILGRRTSRGQNGFGKATTPIKA